MRDKLLKNFGYIGFVLILALVGVVGVEVFGNGFKNIAKTEALIAAFAGAFFAYVFVKLGELFTRLYMGELDNQKAVTEVEHIMNVYMNKLSNNLFVADDMVSTINKPQQNLANLVAVNFNFFKPIEFDTSQLKKLHNLDFLNDLFNYYADLEKLNDSMTATQRFYDILTNGLIEGTLSSDRYRVNVQIVARNINELKKFIVDLRDKSVVMASKAQVLHEQRPALTRLVIRTKPKFYGKDFDLAVKKRVKANEKEIKKNEAKSREEIKKALSRDV